MLPFFQILPRFFPYVPIFVPKVFPICCSHRFPCFPAAFSHPYAICFLRQTVRLRLGKSFACDPGSRATRRGHLRLGKSFTCDSGIEIRSPSLLSPTMPWSPFCSFIHIYPHHVYNLNFPPAFHQAMVSILLLYLNFHPPTFHQAMVSIVLLYLNFPPVRSTKQ